MKRSMHLEHWIQALLVIAIFGRVPAPLCAGAVSAQPDAPFFLAWEKPADAFVDASFALDPPAGKHGPVVVRDGHFAFAADGRRVRFWGTNLSGNACFPEHEAAERLAERLAKYGFDLVRFHGMDGFGKGIFDKAYKDTRHLDPAQLERLDYLIAQLEKRGIYINLNLHVGRRFQPGDGLPQTEWLAYAKYCTNFDPRMIELQKEYARQLLSHRNPYTSKTYAEDPAVITVELTNENSLLGGWTRGFLRGEQRSRPAGGAWTDIPPYYGEELTRFYNQWLQRRYTSREALAKAWGQGARPAGPPMLANGAFDQGRTGWALSVAKPAEAAFDVADSGGGPCAEVRIRRVTDVRWNVMLTQKPPRLRQGEKYDVRLRVKASSPRRVGVEVCCAGEYRGYGARTFDAPVEWSEERLTFVAPRDDDNVRLSIQLGETTGTVWIDDVRLCEAATDGLREGEDPARGTVRRLAPEEFGSVTAARFRDEGRFYYETELAYYRQMDDVLKNELGVKALVQGTNHNYGLPCLWAESQLDLVDCHAYWQHPSFPNRPWSRTDWRIGNSPMLDNPAGGTIGGLCRSAFLGKPFTVSEYNHPFPNEYGCEAPLLLAAYGALQDWDAIYFYTFGHGWENEERTGNVVTGYFDVCNDVPKLAQMPAASLLFRRGDVRPAKRLVTVQYDQQRVFDSLREGTSGFRLAGELSSLLPLVHRFRVAQYGVPQTTRAEEVGFAAPAGEIASDTGELAWTAGDPKQGRLLIRTPRAAAAIGAIGAQAVGEGVSVQADTPFAAVSAISLDGKPIGESGRILVTAAARCANTGMEWNEARNSIGDRWGGAPILIEPVKGHLELRHAAKRLQIVALDGRGVPTGRASVVEPRNGWFRIPLNAAGPATVWYAVTSAAE